MARLTQVLRSVTSSPDRPYCPDIGDIIWINFDPQAGREQAGRRPAVVLSPRSYNERLRLCVLCPITNQVKGYPFEVVLPEGLSVSGAVLSDHIKNLSWDQRQASFICKAPDEVMVHVRAKLKALLAFT